MLFYFILLNYLLNVVILLNSLELNVSQCQKTEKILEYAHFCQGGFISRHILFLLILFLSSFLIKKEDLSLFRDTGVGFLANIPGHQDPSSETRDL